MIQSQINVLLQAESYLHAVSDEQYREVITPLFISSSGQHMRHILDHYSAMMCGVSDALIDYDKRHRGNAIERDIDAALRLISNIKAFLLALSDAQLATTIQVSSEVCIADKRVAVVETTLARELIFVGSHAIHHFAMIAQISKAQKLVMPKQFGIAPSTMTFMRDNPCAP